MQFRMFFVGNRVKKTFLDGCDPYEKLGTVSALNPTGSFNIEFDDGSVEIGCSHSDPTITKVLRPKFPTQT